MQRAVSLTGGWQTTREGAYVQASRARGGTDWHVSRDDLGIDGDDIDRIDRLAAAMRTPGTQIPSINHALADQVAIDGADRSPDLHHSRTAPRFAPPGHRAILETRTRTLTLTLTTNSCPRGSAVGGGPV